MKNFIVCLLTLNVSGMMQLGKMGHKENVANIGELGSAYRTLKGQQRRRAITEVWALMK
jgi:hypothetical protein